MQHILWRDDFPLLPILPNSQRVCTCFSNGKRGCKCHCFCPNWPESADGNSDYMFLGQDGKLVWRIVEISIQEHFFPIYVYQPFYFLLGIISITQCFQGKNMTLEPHGSWKPGTKVKEVKWTRNQADRFHSLLLEKASISYLFLPLNNPPFFV